MKSSIVIDLIISLALAGAVLAAPLQNRALPTPVSAATARTYLAALTVAVESNSPAYNRDLFPTWDTSKLALYIYSRFGAHEVV